jgi:hypothetical protein
MAVFSVKISRELKEKMDRYRDGLTGLRRLGSSLRRR